MHTLNRSRSDAKSRSSLTIKLLSVGMLRRTGSSFKTFRLATRPKIYPTKLRGGKVRPRARSIHSEQCANICATVIFPQWRLLSGLNRVRRSFNSSKTEGSKRCFTGSPSTPELGFLYLSRIAWLLVDSHPRTCTPKMREGALGTFKDTLQADQITVDRALHEEQNGCQPRITNAEIEMDDGFDPRPVVTPGL